jgi:AraC-like DNA-binding protein
MELHDNLKSWEHKHLGLIAKLGIITIIGGLLGASMYKTTKEEREFIETATKEFTEICEKNHVKPTDECVADALNDLNTIRLDYKIHNFKEFKMRVGGTKYDMIDHEKRDLPIQLELNNAQTDFLAYNFSVYDDFELPVEIFASVGTTIYINRAAMEMMGCKDASLLVGKYNLKNDPVCIEICGKEGIERVFRGEAVSFPDFPAPIQDVLDRGVIDEKPWEAAMMDLLLFPVWSGGAFQYTICVFDVRNTYMGRAEIAKAKEHIESHWRETFDADTVAKAVHMSGRHLQRIFTQQTGMSLKEFYDRCKVNHIKDALADKSKTIKEAFAACGEDSRGWATQVFKKITGLAPTEYRAKL